MPEISINSKELQLYTSVSNWFIDNYIRDVNSTFVVVYLFYLRYASSEKEIPCTADAAEMLGVLESDILKSLKHWKKCGILNLVETENGINIHFKNKSGPLEDEYESTTDEIIVQKNLINVNEIPQYSVQELEIYKASSKDIDRLFRIAEEKLGTLLKYTDLNILFGLYDWLKLPLDVIEILITYCVSGDKKNMNYIQSVGIDWAENEINTAEKAHEHIKTFTKDYREILKALGLGKNNPAPVQIEFMDKWLKEYLFPLDIILEACDTTIMQTGKAEFRYCDGILKRWLEKGVKTIEEIKQVEESFRSAQKTTKKSKPSVSKPPAKSNRFANFPQREWDFDKLEKIAREELNNNSH